MPSKKTTTKKAAAKKKPPRKANRAAPTRRRERDKREHSAHDGRAPTYVRDRTFRAKLLKQLGHVHLRTRAAVAAGVTATTWANWETHCRAARARRAEGREPEAYDEDVIDFFDAVEEVEAKTIAALEAQIKIHAEEDPRTCRWLLERLDRKTYAPPQPVDQDGEVVQAPAPLTFRVVSTREDVEELQGAEVDAP